MSKKINIWVLIAGAVVGIAAVALTALGNPANMGFCIACFLRDIAGATKLHSAAVVQYIRPEIIGLVLGSTIIALAPAISAELVLLPMTAIRVSVIVSVVASIVFISVSFIYS